MAVTINPGVNTLNVQMELITGTLSGKVTDSGSGAGISGVAVTLGTAAPVLTDSNGNYGIQGIPPGSYTVKFEKAGYNTVIY